MGGGKWESMDVHHHGGFKSARPIPEKKAVKAIAKVAVTAAAVYYGGSALLSAAGAGTAAGAASSIGTTIKAIASSPYLTAGSLVMQGMGMVQQTRAAGEMQKAEDKRQAAAEQAAASQERQSQVEATRARMAALREQRIIQGRLTAASGQGGMAFGGTSAVAGSTSSLNTQVGTAIGNINVAQGFAQEQGQANIAYGRATSDIYQAANEASGWQQITALGKELRGGESLGASFEKVGTIFSTKPA